MAVREQIILEGKNKTGKAFGKVQKDLRGMQSSLGAVTKMAAGLVAALGFSRLASSTVNTIRKFQDLNATLKTIQGSASAAAISMDMIRKFTAGTTFQLDEVSQAFIILRNAGLQPTKGMMTDLGNIAAGMGQRIDSVAKAVFNATTGEFEMMKQLGIKVKKEGDNITAIFRGVETKMKFNTENILNYLRTIGKEEFAGAIEDRANTLTGAFSNLMDMTDEFQVAIGDAGLTATLTGLAREATGVLTVNTQLAHSIGVTATAAVDNLASGMRFLIKNSDHLYGALGALVTLQVASWIRAIGVAMWALALNPVGALITAVIGLIGYFSFKNGLGRTLQQVTAAVEYFGGILKKFRDFMAEKVGRVIDYVTNAFYSFVDSLIEGYNKIARILPLIEEIEHTSHGLQLTISKGFGNAYEWVEGKADGFYDAVIAGTDKALDSTKDLTKTITDAGKEYDKIQKQILDARRFANMLAEGSLGAAMLLTTTSDAKKGTDVGGMTEAVRKQLDKKVQAIKASLRSEQRVIDDKRNKDLQDLKDYYGNRIAFDEDYLKMKYELEEKWARATERLSQKRINKQFDIIKDGNMSEIDLTKMSKEEVFELTKKTGRQALEDLAQVNKKAFDLNKAMNIASAIMNTATGVTKALAQGGVFGPFLAGAILAMGAAQIAIISQQQYAGRKQGGPVGAGQNYIVGEQGPEVFKAPAGGGMIDNQLMGTTNINFTVNAIDSADFQDALAENRTAILSIVNEAVNNSGRRSIV